jgi:ABC-type amino acid transport substrate-binding protein
LSIFDRKLFLKQEVDVAIGCITITDDRLEVVDFSVSYYQTAAGFIANIPR